MSEVKVPCGGFKLDSSLKLTDGKLGISGGSVYKLIIKSTQVSSSTFVYSFDEDSDIQSYEQLIDKLSSRNNLLINHMLKIYNLESESSDSVTVSVLYENITTAQDEFWVQQQFYTIKNDNTITFEQKNMTLKRSI